MITNAIMAGLRRRFRWASADTPRRYREQYFVTSSDAIQVCRRTAMIPSAQALPTDLWMSRAVRSAPCGRDGMADMPALGAGARESVRVRVPPPAPRLLVACAGCAG